MTTVSKHLDEISPMSVARAKEVDAMPDEEIDYSDIPPLDETFFKTAKRVERILPKPETIPSVEFLNAIALSKTDQ